MDVPAGWYPDPASPTSARWWDGTGWTEHTLPLDQLPPAPQPAPFSVPDGSTLVLPAPSADVVPPLVPAPDQGPDYADTAVYPAAYAPAPSAAAPPVRRSVGWGVIALIGVLAVVLVAAGVLVVSGLTSGSGGNGSTASSGTPTAAPPSASASGGGAAPATAAEAAAVLETFRPTAPTLPAGVEATLIPQGDVAQGQKTLDGWCSDSYATEKDRIARRQWALTQGGQDVGLSIESVAYGTPEQAAAALAEFTARTKACRDVSLTSDGTKLVQNLVSSTALSGLPAGISGYRGTITVDATPTTGAAFSLNSTSTVQQKGQYLTIVWTNQGTPITAADEAVIDRFVAQQTAALATTTS
ncbi:MAG: DUF2510 domain-containing protein [Actinomycetales bacterium]|nr:DUF2510 domain-containing protein [Actinomycetales bacterium]